MCSVKKVFLKILQNSQKKICTRVSFLIKFLIKACNFIEEEPLAQVFSCEFCEFFKNIFRSWTPLLAAFKTIFYLDQNGNTTVQFSNQTTRGM